MTGLASTAVGTPSNARAVMASRDPDADDRDFFPTPPWGARAGAELIKALDPAARSVWEPACGAGHMAHGLADYFDTVRASDAYLYDGNVIHDFLGDAPPPFGAVDWIVTNPPFAEAEAFIRRAHRMARRGVALLMRAAVLEGQGRHGVLFGDCPLTVFSPFSERLPMHKGRYCTETSTASWYAWFIFLKPALRPQRFMVRIGDAWRPATAPIAPGARVRLFRRSDLRFALRRSPRALADIAPLPGGDVMTEAKVEVLLKLAGAGERGVTPLRAGGLNAGTLAALKMFGLAEHAPALDALDDRRFRISPAGEDLLLELGLWG